MQEHYACARPYIAQRATSSPMLMLMVKAQASQGLELHGTSVGSHMQKTGHSNCSGRCTYQRQVQAACRWSGPRCTRGRRKPQVDTGSTGVAGACNAGHSIPSCRLECTSTCPQSPPAGTPVPAAIPTAACLGSSVQRLSAPPPPQLRYIWVTLRLNRSHTCSGRLSPLPPSLLHALSSSGSPSRLQLLAPGRIWAGSRQQMLPWKRAPSVRARRTTCLAGARSAPAEPAVTC